MPGSKISAVALRLLVALAILGSSSAHAEDPEREAKALFHEGSRLAEQGDYAGAVDLFRTAYARYPNPAILWNLAAVLEHLGRLAQAADTYEQFVRHPRTDQGKRVKGAQALALLEAQIGKVKIEVTEPDSRVTLDGKEIGTGMTFTVRVDPGTHTITAEKPGLPSAAATVDIVAGMERTVTLRPGTAGARPVAAPSSPPAGVGSSPPAETASPAAPSAEVTASVEPETASVGRAGRLGMTVRSETDARTGETGPSAGLTYGVNSWLEVSALALIQETKGARVAASAFLTSGALAPFLRVGVPVFFADGARPGVHAAAGVVWDVTSYAGLILDAGVEYLPTVPEPFHKTSIVVGVGLIARPF